MDKNTKKFNKKKSSPFKIILLTFLGIILIGALILMLPISTKEGMNLGFIDSLLLSTSAVCVTGLTPVSDLGATLSIFGRIVLAILIEFGGLGFVTIVITIITLFGFKIGLSNRLLIKEALNHNTSQGLVVLVRKIMKTALIIQAVGIVLNFIAFIQVYDFWSAFGYSIFHSISSFNNAGFDLFGSTSLISYKDNILLNISTSMMIITGGIGFIVIFDIIDKKSFKKLSLHSKIALKTTLTLLITGAIIFKLLMWKDISFLEAIFLSVTARTAGFTSINLNILNSASLLVLIFLMFIGASPSSTGGGIKTTTFYTVITAMITFAFGNKTVKSHNRKISENLVFKAFILITFSLFLILFIALVIMIIENKNFTFEEIIFESFSAFSTCGLSLNVTPYLSKISKVFICILMYVGRLGPITFLSLLNRNTLAEGDDLIQYVEEKIIIG